MLAKLLYSKSLVVKAQMRSAQLLDLISKLSSTKSLSSIAGMLEDKRLSALIGETIFSKQMALFGLLTRQTNLDCRIHVVNYMIYFAKKS